VLPVGDVEAWFENAVPGQRLVYGGGRSLVRGETARFVAELAAAGKAIPHQVRSPTGGGLDFIVHKKAAAGAQAALRGGGAEADESIDVILRSLKRAANFGLRAPSNSDLAREAKLPSPAAVAYRITRLIESGQIRTQAITTGPEAGWRVVTICETGQQTKVPPSWERARAQARREEAR
jgi:hypothetical protein